MARAENQRSAYADIWKNDTRVIVFAVLTIHCIGSHLIIIIVSCLQA